jgi:hypothetical protein
MTVHARSDRFVETDGPVEPDHDGSTLDLTDLLEPMVRSSRTMTVHARSDQFVETDGPVEPDQDGSMLVLTGLLKLMVRSSRTKTVPRSIWPIC